MIGEIGKCVMRLIRGVKLIYQFKMALKRNGLRICYKEGVLNPVYTIDAISTCPRTYFEVHWNLVDNEVILFGSVDIYINGNTWEVITIDRYTSRRILSWYFEKLATLPIKSSINEEIINHMSSLLVMKKLC